MLSWSSCYRSRDSHVRVTACRLRDNFVTPLVVVEYLFVFFPYQFRWLFPKTSFRMLKGGLVDGKDKNDLNRWFFYFGTMLTKAFYSWAKHFIGFFLNYARFDNRMTPEHQYHMHFMLIMSCCALTVSIFLQTLKFKGYIGTINWSSVAVRPFEHCSKGSEHCTGLFPLTSASTTAYL